MVRIVLVLLSLLSFLSLASAAPPDAAAIVEKLMLSDPWGLSGAEIGARLFLTDKSGAKSELAFQGKSMLYDAPLAKSVIRFSAPSELSGAAFLLVQKKEGDDERFLFLPELKRARRIAGSLRSGAFMGTDFSFADLDRRDLRQSRATLKGEEMLAKWPCYVVEVVPDAADSDYSRIEAWIRKDNYLPLRMKLYDRAKAHVKTFEALETKRVSGAWFISKSRMVNHQAKHSTELVLENIAVKSSFPDEEFSVRALEKL